MRNRRRLGPARLGRRDRQAALRLEGFRRGLREPSRGSQKRRRCPSSASATRASTDSRPAAVRPSSSPQTTSLPNASSRTSRARSLICAGCSRVPSAGRTSWTWRSSGLRLRLTRGWCSPRTGRTRSPVLAARRGALLFPDDGSQTPPIAARLPPPGRPLPVAPAFLVAPGVAPANVRNRKEAASALTGAASCISIRSKRGSVLTSPESARGEGGQPGHNPL